MTIVRKKKTKMTWRILLFLVMNLFYLFLGYGYFSIFLKHHYNRRFLFLGGWGALWLMMFVLYYYLVYGTNRIQMLSACGIFSILLVSSIVLGLYDRIQEDVDEKVRDAMYQQQLEYYSRQYEDISRTQQETRKMRHELKNQYILIKALAEKGDCPAIIEIMKQMHQEVEGLVRCKTGNLAVDAVINYKIAATQEDGIQFELNLNIPTKFDINDIKLCGLLGNAIDNAIEACRRIQSGKRRIQISMVVQKKNLFIEVKNPYDGTLLQDTKGKLLTRKAQTIHHGFGISIMEELLRNNYGTMEIAWDKQEFCLRMILYMVI